MRKEEQENKAPGSAPDEKSIQDINNGEPFEDSAMNGDNAEEAAWDERGIDESQTEKLEKELGEQKDKYLRLVAEFDNYRKRISRERIELMQTANKDVVISLLDILDDCDRATGQMENTDDADIVKEGALLIFNKFRNHLQALGLKEMESYHEDFDPELHEAIAEVPAPSEDLKGKVIDNIQKGYYLNDKLIRHAKVVVGK